MNGRRRMGMAAPGIYLDGGRFQRSAALSSAFLAAPQTLFSPRSATVSEKPMPQDEFQSGDLGRRFDYAAAFTAGLLDPDRAPPDSVSGPNGKAAIKRYAVYRNNVTASLIDALAASFPATLRITGPDFFRAMARFHIRETPPTSPLLFEYGRDFPDFIERYEHAQSMPWLADVARIERAWLDAYHAADAEALSAEALASILARGLPTPCCGRIRRRGSRAPGSRQSRSSRQTGTTLLLGRSGQRALKMRWSRGPASRSSSATYHPAAQYLSRIWSPASRSAQRPRRRLRRVPNSSFPPTLPACWKREPSRRLIRKGEHDER